MGNTLRSSISPDGELPSDKAVWIFQCNPRLYQIKEALSDEEVTRCFHWKVIQFKGEITKGDIGIIWCSGASAGIYAITELISSPEDFLESDYEKKYWVDSTSERGSQFRVKMRVIRNVAKMPIARGLIMNTDGLQHLSIIRMPRGTNFKVTASEWRLIKDLIYKINN